MLMNHGKMAAVHSLRLGTVLIEQSLKSLFGASSEIHRFLEEFTRNTGANLKTEINLNDIKVFITIGTEARIAALSLGKQIGPRVWSISKEKYNKFVKEVSRYSVEEVMARFSLSYTLSLTLRLQVVTGIRSLPLPQGYREPSDGRVWC